MKKEIWMGKRIFVRLKTGSVYTGEVLEIEGYEEPYMFTIKDKFGKYVSFLSNEISYIQEERG